MMKSRAGRWVGAMLTIMLIAVVALPATASARPAKTKHEVTGTLRVKSLETGGGYPAAGGTYTALGLVELSIDGKAKRGVLESQGTIAQPDPSTIQAKQEDVSYFTDGSYKLTSTGTATPNPDGGFTTEATSKVTGGTGSYKGATGSLTSNCTAPSLDPSAVVTCDVKGTVSY
jgi:hypothetical protein